MKCQRLLRGASVLACIATFTACGEGLEPTSRITKARIIGAQYSVQEDPSRTSARPGETLDVALLVTQPGEPTLNTWSFLVCVPAPTTFGVPRCSEDEPLALFSVSVPVAEAPAFSLRIPEGTQGDLLYVGAVCMGGEVGALDGDDLSALANPCAGAGVGRLVTGTLRVQVQGEAFVNHAPEIERITLRGEPWTATPPAVTEACRDSELPLVSYSNGDVALIEVFPSAGSRERVPTAEDPAGELEELPVAFFSTERGLSKFYSVIDDRRAHAEAEFGAREITIADAESIPATGRVARFEFVMRDDHGGVDRATRAFCLVP